MTRQLRPERAIYHIEEAVGQGLSATVYRAVRVDARGFSRQTVALKILKSENAVPWLKREFETLTRLQSPNCVRVLGWENLKEGCALVLEWIDGVRLFDLGRDERLSARAQASLLAQIQCGLRALHAQGLYHGDLSPSNILIDRTGCVKLIDFATPEEGSQQDIHGTIEYLAPELWQGGARGEKADLFALGLIVHDLEKRFLDHPLTHLQARDRAFRHAGAEPGLTSLDPMRRNFIAANSDEESRAELAQAVRAHLASRAEVRTAVISREAGSVPENWASLRLYSRVDLSNIWRSVRRLALCAAMLAMVVSTTEAHAPCPRVAQEPGSLEIRSVGWLEASLNGKRLGFAPISVAGLRPGSHRIAWKSSAGAGETRIIIHPGETTRIRDRDLGVAKR